MKIWNEFNSSHSNNITIIGKFESAAKAKEALEVVSDITLSSWEERHPNLNSFLEQWEGRGLGYIKVAQLTETDMVSGIDNSPDISISGDTIKIEHFRHTNVHGIMKVMMHMGASMVSAEEK